MTGLDLALFLAALVSASLKLAAIVSALAFLAAVIGACLLVVFIFFILPSSMGKR